MNNKNAVNNKSKQATQKVTQKVNQKSSTQSDKAVSNKILADKAIPDKAVQPDDKTHSDNADHNTSNPSQYAEKMDQHTEQRCHTHPQTDSENQSQNQSQNQFPFDFQSISQLYLNQLQQFQQLSQSYLDEVSHAVNPLEANMKAWQASMSAFNSLFMPSAFASSDIASDTASDSDKGADGNTSHHSNNSHHSKNSNNNRHGSQDGEQAVNPFTNFNAMSQKLLHDALNQSANDGHTGQSLMLDLMGKWQRFMSEMMENNPTTLLEHQTTLWQQQLQLCQNTVMKLSGSQPEPVITPKKGDKRFNDEEWSSNPLFDYLKQSYLLTVTSIMETIDEAQGVDDKTRQRLSFFTRQWLNALAPSNFLWSNPEVMRLTVESGGQNLLAGLKQLTEDMKKSAQVLSIRMTDKSAFKLGENIASTAGKVVFRNRMFELLQYQPTTAKVSKRPLLIVPPWINKFYILDLKEKNSYIRWALDQGHSVFVISWVNPTRAYKDVGMETYMHEGLLTALDVVKQITGEPDANVIGYCIGGMLLALTLSWLAENKQAERIASATFWTTLFDFSDPGDLGVFIDERIVHALEQEEARKGVFDGRMMGVAFSLLRENSLYWNYYVQNYLKGERPTAFDLLYWNSDCTNVTAALHSFLLRELYLGNKMMQKGELEFSGVKIDLSKVTTPTYIVATLQDHIAKWQGSYQATRLLGGEVTFVLGESGHIAGIINPPTGKYGYYTYDNYDIDADEWFDMAVKHEQSWWLHWAEWVEQHTNGEVDSRQLGVDHRGKTWQVLGDAPGEYVRKKADEALDDEAGADESPTLSQTM